jgi:hypothetical protein
MGHFIYRTPFFDKQLKALTRTDRKGALAAEQAGAIISQLTAYGWECTGLRHKRTRHGEMRLRKCLKYDLGSGYRLISLKGDGELYLMYIGTHDECDRWLNKKRGSKLQVEPESLVFVAKTGEGEPEPGQEPECRPDAEPDEYEQQLAARLSDTVLRQIFPGICQR